MWKTRPQRDEFNNWYIITQLFHTQLPKNSLHHLIIIYLICKQDIKKKKKTKCECPQTAKDLDMTVHSITRDLSLSSSRKEDVIMCLICKQVIKKTKTKCECPQTAKDLDMTVHITRDLSLSSSRKEDVVGWDEDWDLGQPSSLLQTPLDVNGLEAVEPRKHTSASHASQDVGTSSLHHGHEALILNDLCCAVDGTLVLDGLAGGHHHAPSDGVDGVRQ
eukprot:GHVL01043610.1.p2 GENE.GHVL01043610.1~~GHVL01043610.1.p2  ORF type:complete len:219 (-),score=20.59 GHVL01043610.1:782-1438(-)